MHSTQLTVLRALIERLPKPDDCPPSAQVGAILQRMTNEAGSIYELITNPDAMKSNAANGLLINAEKAKLRDLIDSARSTLARIINDFRASDDNARAQKARLIPDAYASEIWAVFRSLDSTNQLSYIGDAVKRGDAATVAAVCLAPSAVTGLDPVTAEQFKESFLDSLAPSQNGSYADQMADCVKTFLMTADEIAKPDAATA